MKKKNYIASAPCCWLWINGCGNLPQTFISKALNGSLEELAEAKSSFGLRKKKIKENRIDMKKNR